MTTSRGPAFNLLLLCVVAGALVHTSLAATYTLAWSIPSSTTFYEDWASSKTFFVGDVIEFDYNFGAHNVLAVFPKDAASCDTSNPLQTWSAGSPKVSLDTAGTISFICGFPNHCSLGMKMTVTVLQGTASPPPTPELPPPSPSHHSPSPPAGSAPPAPLPSPPPKKKSGSTTSMAPAPAPVVKSPAPSAMTPAPGPKSEVSAAFAVRSTALLAFVASLLVSFSALLL
ncbi:hypothetical protein R1flu_006028 [Riccia fluitans]|uniref:Phytocyanin domain-containing protein n=1 Tax=Riccia fluitans TaxID=41844 RepID=A0ABD1YUV3_9MARC